MRTKHKIIYSCLLQYSISLFLYVSHYCYIVTLLYSYLVTDRGLSRSIVICGFSYSNLPHESLSHYAYDSDAARSLATFISLWVSSCPRKNLSAFIIFLPYFSSKPRSRPTQRRASTQKSSDIFS